MTGESSRYFSLPHLEEPPQLSLVWPFCTPERQQQVTTFFIFIFFRHFFANRPKMLAHYSGNLGDRMGAIVWWANISPSDKAPTETAIIAGIFFFDLFRRVSFIITRNLDTEILSLSRNYRPPIFFWLASWKWTNGSTIFPFFALQAQNVSKRAEALKIQIGPSFNKWYPSTLHPWKKNYPKKEKFLLIWNFYKRIRLENLYASRSERNVV